KGIEGTSIRSRELPEGFLQLPSYEEVIESKEKFCDMQNMINSDNNLAQKTGSYYILQYKFPQYTTKELDEYYELPYTREINSEHLKGFEFSVVTHRGCVGNCNFCSLRLMSKSRIVSRSEESIIREVKKITKMPHFKGNIDDLGGPSANMYGMDCNKCRTNNCINCKNLDKTHTRIINLLRELRKIPLVKKVYVRSGVRYDLANDEYLKELKPHVSGTLKIAPEHVSTKVLELMNKNKGSLEEFIKRYKELGCGELSYYFMVAHPGSSMKEAKELASKRKQLKNSNSVQIFTPTPMTESTCMYYTEMIPKTKKPVHVPRTYKEKKDQLRILKINEKSNWE
ncbi:YgiQ family radical SAM protein, partial [Candidatus Pacearchaeota archaeon CG10_big_fil_rev_8_21_14_0_10_35_13]